MRHPIFDTDNTLWGGDGGGGRGEGGGGDISIIANGCHNLSSTQNWGEESSLYSTVKCTVWLLPQ